MLLIWFHILRWDKQNSPNNSPTNLFFDLFLFFCHRVSACCQIEIFLSHRLDLSFPEFRKKHVLGFTTIIDDYFVYFIKSKVIFVTNGMEN